MTYRHRAQQQGGDGASDCQRCHTARTEHRCPRHHPLQTFRQVRLSAYGDSR